MSLDLNDFHRDLFQDVLSSADSDGRYLEDAFFEHATAYLVEAGDLETADRAQHLSTRGVRIDGYGGDPLANEGVLSLIIIDFSQSSEVETLTGTEMDALFKRLQNFLTKALDPAFREALEETTPAFGLADLIASRWSATSKVRFFLITNRKLSSRVDGREAGKLDGIPTTYSVWDIERLHRFAAAGQTREDLEIDLEKEFNGPLPALPAHVTSGGYEAYLLVIPGSQLAAIYDRWGSRLLEQNVRVFLQARGGVNKGIRNTLELHPEMFFAYNNGITATAENVKLRSEAGVTLVTGLTNLQIVNGGQTTASIHAASRKNIDLASVFVQMKLSIVPPAKAIEVVPKISEYANSQNKVNAADFFANHPFHVRMEGFSRRIFIPSADGSFRESKWFYERARGQYYDARGLLSAAQQKKFDLEFPKRQVFSKTDLAKYAMVWRESPEVVSRGAQKNFGEFARLIGAEWSKQSDVFNESFYQDAVAMAIVFQRTEKLVTDASWYEGGYRANIVAYALSKIAYDVRARGRAIDFNAIWRTQLLSSHFEAAIERAAKAAQEVLMDPPTGTRNVSEWAKNQACWSRLQTVAVQWDSDWINELLTVGERREGSRAAIKEQRVLDGIEAQTFILNAGAEVWAKVRQWAAQRSLLSPIEASVLEVASAVPKRVPSEKQSAIVLTALKRLHAEGCPFGEKAL